MIKGMHVVVFPHHPDVVPLLIPNDAFHFVSSYSVQDHAESVSYMTPDGEANWDWFPEHTIVGSHGQFTTIPGSWAGTFISKSGFVANESFAPGHLSGHFDTDSAWSMKTGDYVHLTPYQLSPHDHFLFV
jgi:hypothetical protein